MSSYSRKFATLIGSRICHDLSNPMGAVANGLELMTLSGGGMQGPELSLVNLSIAAANARIRLFRIAFGQAEDGADIAASDLAAILRDLYSGGRISPDFQGSGDLPRPLAQALLLATLCAEQALARGGTLSITQDGDLWRVTARSEHLSADAKSWQHLTKTATQQTEITTDISPAQVQFAMLPQVLAEDLSRTCTVDLTATSATITF